MATKVQQTSWSHTKGTGFPFDITIPATTAGNKLVLVTMGGSIQTARLNNSSGTLFDKRIPYQSGAAFEYSVQDVVCVGGETIVNISLNGEENNSGTIFEVSNLGAFVGYSTNGTGVSTDTNRAVQTTTSVTATVKSVLFTVFGVQANPAGSAPARPFGPEFRFRQMGPMGLLHGAGATQNTTSLDGSHLYAAGIADVDQNGSWPVTESPGHYRAESVYVTGGTAYAGQALYVNGNTTDINPPPANAIVAENSLPGIWNSNWFLGELGTNAGICGYADKLSYSPGQTVNFKVNSNDSPYRVEIYRLGHYGWDSFGARIVTPAITGTIVGQAAPTVDSVYGSTSCSWTTSDTWTIPTTATTGRYYVIFRRTDIGSTFATTHFTVRGTATGKANIVGPDMTNNAYNLWGGTSNFGGKTDVWTGRSLYEAGGLINNFAARAYAGSFDRPFGTQSSQPNTYMFDGEMSIAVWMEAQGYDLNYLSDMDLENDPTILTGAQSVIPLGHQEYWTTNIYNAYLNAKAAGVNMVWSSGNTGLWHVRFDSADTGKRLMICYKENSTRDVSAGAIGTGYDPSSEWTGTWRDSTPANGKTNSDVRKENALTGQWFKLNGQVAVQTKVPFAMKGVPCWRNSASVQALTTGQEYTTTRTVLGYELDYLDGSVNQPTNLVKLTSTTLDFPGQGANAAGTIYTLNPGAVELNFSLWRDNSGSLIFSSGSWRTGHGLSRWVIQGYNDASTPSVDWQNFWLCLLHDMGLRAQTLRAMNPGSDTDPVNPTTGAPGPTRDNVAASYGLIVTSPTGNPGAFFSFF